MPWIKGNDLNPRQRAEVLSAYGYRWTVENKQRARQWYSRLGVPSIDPVPDSEWLETHTFCFVSDGSRLSARVRHCVPAFLADEE